MYTDLLVRGGCGDRAFTRLHVGVRGAETVEARHEERAILRALLTPRDRGEGVPAGIAEPACMAGMAAAAVSCAVLPAPQGTPCCRGRSRSGTLDGSHGSRAAPAVSMQCSYGLRRWGDAVSGSCAERERELCRAALLSMHRGRQADSPKQLRKQRGAEPRSRCMLQMRQMRFRLQRDAAVSAVQVCGVGAGVAPCGGGEGTGVRCGALQGFRQRAGLHEGADIFVLTPDGGQRISFFLGIGRIGRDTRGFPRQLSIPAHQLLCCSCMGRACPLLSVGLMDMGLTRMRNLRRACVAHRARKYCEHVERRLEP